MIWTPVALLPLLALWVVAGRRHRGADVCATALLLLLLANGSGSIGSLFAMWRWPGLGFALIALLRWRRGRAPVRPLDLLVVVPLPLLALCSALWSRVPEASLQRGFAFSAGIACAAMLAWDPVRKARFDVLAARVFALIGVASTIWWLSEGMAVGSVAGVFGNKNALGVSGAIGVPLILSTTDRLGVGVRALLTRAGGLLLAIGTVVSGSRGGVIGATVGCVCYAALARRRRVVDGTELGDSRRPKRRAILVGVSIAIMVLGVLWIRGVDQFGISNRDSQWSSLSRVAAGRVVLGTGFGTTQHEFLTFQRDIGYDPREKTGANYHSSYLTLVSELGLVGVLAIAPLVVGAFRRMRFADPTSLSVVAAGLASAVGESWIFAIGSGWSLVFWVSLLRTYAARERGRMVWAPPKHTTLTGAGHYRSDQLVRLTW